jgi:hypothetical protein
MYKAKLWLPLRRTGWRMTMAAEGAPAGSTDTAGAASEGACRPMQSRQGARGELRSTLLKPGWDGVPTVGAQKCAACTHPASSSTLAQKNASVVRQREPGAFMEIAT